MIWLKPYICKDLKMYKQKTSYEEDTSHSKIVGFIERLGHDKYFGGFVIQLVVSVEGIFLLILAS